MKGYFFRLAQHTGLRLKPQAAAAQKSGGAIEPRSAATESRLAQQPLHQEETVFVSETQTENSARTSLQEKDLNAPLPLKRQAVLTPSRENNFSSEAAKTSTARDANLSSSVTREGAAQDALRKSFSSSNASQVEALLQPQDARVLIEQPATAHETIRHQESAPTLSPPEVKQSASLDISHESKAEQAAESRELLLQAEPEHFKETASLLENGVTDKELLQKVFLKEIHEWVAAPAETIVKTVTRETQALEENLQRVSLIEPDEGAALALSRPRAVERERLEQHDLSLSIGSISIVIEEPQQQAQPSSIQTQPRAESSRPQSSSDFSRLSRHYIR